MRDVGDFSARVAALERRVANRYIWSKMREMPRNLLRSVVRAAASGVTGTGGWIRVDSPGASDRDISAAIMEAKQLGLVEACEVTTGESSYPEWRLVGVTAAGQGLLRESSSVLKSPKWQAIGAIATIMTMVMMLFIPEIRNKIGLGNKPGQAQRPIATAAPRDSGPAVANSVRGSGAKVPPPTPQGAKVTQQSNGPDSPNTVVAGDGNNVEWSH